MNIVERLAKCGKTQTWLIKEIRERSGVNVYPAEMSRYLRGVVIGPKAERVIKISDEILSEIER